MTENYMNIGSELLNNPPGGVLKGPGPGLAAL